MADSHLRNHAFPPQNFSNPSASQYSNQSQPGPSTGGPWFANPSATPANVGNFAPPPPTSTGSTTYDDEDYENEPPLLEGTVVTLI